MEITPYHPYFVNLDATIGHEIEKTHPCLVNTSAK